MAVREIAVTAADVSPADRSNWEQISVLLHEYDTLRTDVLARNANFVNLGTATLAAVVGIVAIYYTTRVSAHLLLLCFLVVGAFAWFSYRSIHLAIKEMSEQLRGLELQINVLANAKLLTWERCHGFGGLVDLRKGDREAERAAPL